MHKNLKHIVPTDYNKQKSLSRPYKLRVLLLKLIKEKSFCLRIQSEIFLFVIKIKQRGKL